MTEHPEEHAPEEHVIEEYPEGLLEKPGGPVPLFLKLTYVGFILFGVIYFIRYFSGDGSPLVEMYNELTGN